MKYLPVLLFVVPILCTAGETGSAECELDGPQMQMNACAYERYQKADAELNGLYKQQMARLGEVNGKRLRDSQRAWIAYKDKACLYEAGPAEGSGSIWGLENYMCLVYFTKQRSEVLRRYIQCTQNGCPE